MAKKQDKQRHINARERGFIAAKQCYHINTNPYPPNSKCSDNWLQGYFKYKKQKKA